MAFQTGGKIVVVGSASVKNYDQAFALARFHPNGTLDTTFGGDGRVTTTFGPAKNTTTSWATVVAIQTDGKIVVAGGLNYERTPNEAYENDFALARYHPNGNQRPGTRLPRSSGRWQNDRWVSGKLCMYLGFKFANLPGTQRKQCKHLLCCRVRGEVLQHVDML
jgi:uncharacterized delta-60 repeat protein